MLEGDEDDRFITSNFFEEANYPVRLEFVHSSAELQQYLSACEKFPALILLSQQAGPKSVTEILRQIKSDPAHRHIPAVVLGGVLDPGMVKEYYACGASSFIEKPAGTVATRAKIESFFRYWFETVELV